MATEVGKLYGRADLDRCGLFWEMSYMNGKYVKPLELAPVRTGVVCFPIGYPKWKRGLQDCYFDKDPLKRLYEGEAYYDALKEYYKEITRSNKKNLSKVPYITFTIPKETSTPGDHWGTFEDANFAAISPLERPKPKEVPKKPFYVPFPKKGTYGFNNYTIEKFPEYTSDFYDAGPVLFAKSLKEHRAKLKDGPFQVKTVAEPYFDPNPYLVENPAPTYKEPKPPKTKEEKSKPAWVWGGPLKKLSGDKSGCFDKYPTHTDDKYMTEAQVRREWKKRLMKYSTRDSGLFNGACESKKWYIKSTADYNINFKVHSKNWRCARPFVRN